MFMKLKQISNSQSMNKLFIKLYINLFLSNLEVKDDI